MIGRAKLQRGEADMVMRVHETGYGEIAIAANLLRLWMGMAERHRVTDLDNGIALDKDRGIAPQVRCTGRVEAA